MRIVRDGPLMTAVAEALLAEEPVDQRVKFGDGDQSCLIRVTLIASVKGYTLPVGLPFDSGSKVFVVGGVSVSGRDGESDLLTGVLVTYAPDGSFAVGAIVQKIGLMANAELDFPGMVLDEVARSMGFSFQKHLSDLGATS